MPAIIDTHVHLRETRDELVEDLRRKAYYGVGVVLSLGRGSSDMAFQVRDEVIPNAARYRTVGRGITAPEPGRTEIPFWISTEAEARAAVQALAPRNVDMVKIWVDDRNGQFEKLTPELYGAVIDEAHQQGLRVTAHVYTLEDAKGLLRAGLDAFAHGIRDMDVDDEVVELFAERPNVVLVPNLPNPGVAADLSWLSATIPPDDRRMFYQKANMLWHADSSFKAIPSLCSVLSAREVPPAGGATEFASTRAAFEELDAGLQARLEGAVVEYDFSYSRGLAGFEFTPSEAAEFPAVRHRLVRVNANTGRKSVLIGAHAKYIVGWPEDESRAMLDDLLSRAKRHAHRHDWRQGDVIIWDNQAAVHRATPFDAIRHRRLMQRTTISSRDEAAAQKT
jgi:alpha-ketoglutarate-dependent 2,4-dichlorophenoxyacetate dioxygenase